MPPPHLLLFRVATTWSLPGLGLLALPDGGSPHLMGYQLHTALAVAAVRPDGSQHRAIATVEEIERTASTERGLLLDFAPELVEQLPVGTEIWLVEGEAGAVTIE